MSTDLRSDVALRNASLDAVRQHRADFNLDGWLEVLGAWLLRVRAVDHATFVSAEFQQELWDNEAVSATGQGHVDVSRVVAAREVAEKLWSLKQTPPPADADARKRWLANAWDEISALVEPLTDRRPHLKQYRVFASLWPDAFTTIAHFQKLRRLAQAAGLSRGNEHDVHVHQRMLERLTEVLGSLEDASERERLERMTLPWLLFVHHVQDQASDATELPSEVPGEVRLNPLPADRRRRGMLAVAGLLPSVLAMLEFAKDGCKRTDFLEHIRSVNPRLAPSSLGTNLNALIAEWGALRAEDDELHLTPRGEALLETGEPEEVSDWLLTRILGFDNLLHMLRDTAVPQKQVIAHLQQVNPGWTSNFAPTVLINWAKGMDLTEVDADRMLRLTSRGREWAARVHWTPGFLAQPAGAPAATADAHKRPEAARIELPALADIMGAFPEDIAFAPSLVARLHAGVWSHPRRHFAVLTGLSGAGKTQLALGYAKGLRSGGEGDPREGLHVQPVQPGWHDPSSLLGYPNPLHADVYMRTEFLDFLMRASADSSRPYTVVLDEMNLSHPEQYLAPLLSAMETGGAISLHAHEEEVGGVPPSIDYPENLVLIGTVNMDETTHGLSDKVLDRASVIEFWDIDVAGFPGWASSGLEAGDLARVRDTLDVLVRALRPVRLHFGWRTIQDVIGYVRMASTGGVIGSVEALDHAIYAKVLPKLRGEDTVRLRQALKDVSQILRDRRLGESAGKVEELAGDLDLLGSARFWR